MLSFAFVNKHEIRLKRKSRVRLRDFHSASEIQIKIYIWCNLMQYAFWNEK